MRLPSILLDIVLSRINTAQIMCRPFRFYSEPSTRPPRGFDITLRLTMTYSVDNKEGYGVDHRLPSLVTTYPVFHSEVFVVRLRPIVLYLWSRGKAIVLLRQAHAVADVDAPSSRLWFVPQCEHC